MRRAGWLCRFGFLVLLGFVALQAYGVKVFRVSEYQGGHQIWFEAEAFDERIPEGDRFFQIAGQKPAPKPPKKAFGTAMTRAGGAGGRISWTFDISRAGGKAGTWYFWGRIANPSNQSDYMLVKGDPQDKKIPDTEPFPGGDGVPPFDNADDRVFEQTVAPWGWWGNGSEGSTKELQDGENTMYIFHRQGNSTVFWDVFMWSDDRTYRPTDDDYVNAKELEESQAVEPTGKLATAWARLKTP